MKTMTCKQLGGPCDLEHHGQTADEVIKAQDRHLKDVVAAGDAAHESAFKDMKGALEASHRQHGLVQADEAGVRRRWRRSERASAGSRRQARQPSIVRRAPPAAPS